MKRREKMPIELGATYECEYTKEVGRLVFIEHGLPGAPGGTPRYVILQLENKAELLTNHTRLELVGKAPPGCEGRYMRLSGWNYGGIEGEGLIDG